MHRAAQLNLTQYWGVWGGKYCYSAYDPPPPAGRNNTKAPCPVIKQPPLPKIRPVDLPRITQLSSGQIFVGGADPQPLQIKVTQCKISKYVAALHFLTAGLRSSSLGSCHALHHWRFQ